MNSRVSFTVIAIVAAVGSGWNLYYMIGEVGTYNRMKANTVVVTAIRSIFDNSEFDNLIRTAHMMIGRSELDLVEVEYIGVEIILLEILK